jgi:alcohol dehydrogenase (cytochrome c)
MAIAQPALRPMHASLSGKIRRFCCSLCLLVVAAGGNASIARSQTDLPSGAGRLELERICTRCHGLNVITGQRMSAQLWTDEVQDMISRGAIGSDEEVKRLVAYLSTNFGRGPSMSQAGRSVDSAVSGPAIATAIFDAWPDTNDGVTPQRLLHPNAEPQNWLTFAGSYGSQHYSLLNQITSANAHDLELKWVFQSRWLDPYETTPLVVDGVLYTMQGDDVVALDATTGRLFWIYRYTPVPEARLCCGRISRGLAILGSTLYMAAVDAHLIAIDAKTGVALWNTKVAETTSGYTMTIAPLVVRDKVIVGVAGGEYGIRGFIAAYDAHFGKEVWRFYTTAAPSEPGGDTWGGDSWKHGAGSVWLTGSYDPDSNLLFWGTGNAGPDYNGDVRPGDNLYTCSMVALDADTGKLKWHYQANPHNEFDWDAVQTPVLANINWNGKPRKVVLWADRNGFYYVLDRNNGEFLLGTAFVKQNWNAGFEANGRPIMSANSKSSTEGVQIFPDNQGGTNWFPPSFDPATGLFYVNAREGYSTVFVKGDQDYEEGARYDGRGRIAGARPPLTVGADEEKYTAVRALDPKTGALRWQYKLNSANSLHTFEGWQTTAGAAGILTTAGNVLFTGGREGYFVVLNASDGTLLWKSDLGGPMLMGPITYSVEGKQYVAINAGTSLFVFGLRPNTGSAHTEPR